MKKKLLLVTLMLTMALTGCSKAPVAGEEEKAEAVVQEEEKSEEAEAAKKELPGENKDKNASGGGGEGGPTYKELMVPFEQLNYSDRIVVLQNTLRYLMDGFYTEETKPVAEEIQYGGATVEAYPITYAINFLTNGSEGTVSVTDTEGTVTEMSAEDFAAMYVIVDFRSEEAPILYHPENGTEIAFAYAATSEGEGIYSIASGTSHKCVAMAEACGWNLDQMYRIMAADKFYIPVSFTDNPEGELRGTLSGAISGSIPDFKIAGGKINDVIYIEKIVE